MQKVKRFKCKKYTEWVKSLPSCVSLCPSDDPHHVSGVIPGGMGTKPHDLFCIPLTRVEHTSFHNIGKTLWEENYETNQAEEALKTINKALKDGLIDIRWIGD